MSTYRFRGGARLVTWLLKQDPKAGYVLRQYGKPANDNHQTLERETDIDGNTPLKPSIEYLHETKPKPDDMVSQAYRTRATNTVERRRQLKSSKPSTWIALEHGDQPATEGRTTRVGDLVFSSNPIRREHGRASGLMVSYQTDKAGKPVAPEVKTKKPRGGKTQKRVVKLPTVGERNPRKLGYLDLRGVDRSDEYRVPVSFRGGAHVAASRTDSAIDADNELAVWRDRIAAFPVTKCPPGIAYQGAIWLGGVVRAKQTSSRGAIPLAQQYEKPELPEAEARVLEEALSNSTFTDIGTRLGYKGRYADKAGKHAFLRAVSVLVANDNGQEKEKAA
ncbi:hypothetical protein [Phyllobacterium zundukense]|uniref:Uncharacterized protein n=1 Tax=Phyllobacterium zundukense TaxID=1867719 RepID=A0ACD4D6U1_9HYPH|nr:hypothetical protein [Phyllobacterium zundukense]UXN61571.1 hypothetical protein N8E88_16050 [Phyllobacterium zundukense]